MAKRSQTTMDGNEAATSVAYRVNELLVVHPTTPVSPMGELADAWSVEKRTNLWGLVPEVVKLRSDIGVAGALHGALQGGALATTFTASHGLLLLIPNMYRMAGELLPCCLHVASRTVASHASSIFCDHSDVMAARQTGCALLASGSLQEAHDQALIAHAATLRARVPFVHFFDGFRTSHELGQIQELSDSDLLAMLDEDLVQAHRGRALSPHRPFLRGTTQGPDVFFQAREACNPFYQACPGIVQESMDRFAELTGRSYRLFDYVGHPEAERIIVLMGSGAETAHETVERCVADGEKVGLVKVRLYRPFSVEAFVAALPASASSVAVLDRTKEPGAVGEPLYLDVVAALDQAGSAGLTTWAKEPRVVGGRYGLSSKEFDPACVRSVFQELSRAEPRNGFTVGIEDDVSRTSLPLEPHEGGERNDVVRAVFYGLGSDGTVAANRSSVKIIGNETASYAQAYFVYDSKKAGAVTVSHLRVGPRPIRSSYLIRDASFVACHQFAFLEQLDVLARAADGGIVLLNSPYGPAEVWDRLPREVQETILEKKLRLHVIDAYRLAREGGLGWRISSVMQVCFLLLTRVVPREAAVAAVKKSIQSELGSQARAIVDLSWALVDRAFENCHQVSLTKRQVNGISWRSATSQQMGGEAGAATTAMLAHEGDHLPVSAFSPDGTWSTGTSKLEKRNVAQEIPVWEPDICIQCAQCAFVCPHTAIRTKVYDAMELDGAPVSYLSSDCKAPELKGLKLSVQVAPEDCTGCRLCVEVCPARDKANPRRKAINMEPQRAVREREKANFQHFVAIPQTARERIQRLDARGSQLMEPLFEYPGACAGCGETPYLKILTQLFGDRLVIANAPGCSSNYGGHLPTTPYSINGDGRGPAWSSSLLENNAELGLGLRLAADGQRRLGEKLLTELASQLGDELVEALLEADQEEETGLVAQRQRVAVLKARLTEIEDPRARALKAVADDLVRKSVWIVGGDGWACDGGNCGLQQVLGMGLRVNVLVLDTQVYSDTGGHVSAATPLGAAAKFAATGKDTPSRDIGLEAIGLGNVYVAQIAFAARMAQTVQAMLEAEAYPGASILVAYSHCIAHGFDLARGADQQRLAVVSGHWPVYRFNPRNSPSLRLDSGPPKKPVAEFMSREMRFRMVEKLDGERFRQLAALAQEQVRTRYAELQRIAGLSQSDGSS